MNTSGSQCLVVCRKEGFHHQLEQLSRPNVREARVRRTVVGAKYPFIYYGFVFAAICGQVS